MIIKQNSYLKFILLFIIVQQYFNVINAAQNEFSYFSRDTSEGIKNDKIFYKVLNNNINSDYKDKKKKNWKNNKFAEQRFPDAIIIGAKKCGTRALLEFLRLNPRICAPGPEVHFFDKNFDKGFDWYRKQMPLTTQNHIVLEKSPSYFVSKHVPERVYILNPKMKLILVVRNPITRAISDYTQTHETRHKSMFGAQTFDQLVTCNWSKNTFNDHNYKQCVGNVNVSVGPIRIGIYHKHLHNWLEYFPLRQILIVDGEQLIKEPAKELRAVEHFLRLNPENFVMDSAKGFQCIQKPGNTKHCLPKSKGRQHPHVSNKTLNMLNAFYAPENEKFYQLIGRRFNWT